MDIHSHQPLLPISQRDARGDASLARHGPERCRAGSMQAGVAAMTLIGIRMSTTMMIIIITIMNPSIIGYLGFFGI